MAMKKTLMRPTDTFDEAGKDSSARPVVHAIFAIGIMLMLFGIAQPALAQNVTTPCTTTSLCLDNVYFVTGDYVLGGVGLRGLGVNGFATGTISIPDKVQPQQNGVASSVPAGADIVAAFLYWDTVESSSQSPHPGQKGFFNGYAITGTILGNPNAPTSWSAGGCSGNSQGAKTMVSYVADVHPYLPRDTDPASPTFGRVIANGNFSVSLADSGSNGGGTPLTMGATLVVIYRVLSPTVPLNAIVLYDGALTPNNSSSTMTQPIVGFYQPAASPVAKITHIVGNGQSNKSESVFLNGANLPSLYPNSPPFPGRYNGSWDNPTWPVSAEVHGSDTSETTSVVPAGSNGGCVNWGVVIFSTTVADNDGDGLLNVWKMNQGYIDAKTGQQVALPGAKPNEKDIFVEVDYLSNFHDQSPGPYLHSHLPKQAALDMVGNAFANKGIHIHFDVGNVYQIQSPADLNPDPYIIPYKPNSAYSGHPISEASVLCTDSATLCAFPGQPTVAWKGGFEFVKGNPSVPNSNPPVPLGNFQPARGLSYHYMLFGHALGDPRSFWSDAETTLSNPSIPQLISIVNSGTTATVTIQSPSGVLKPGDPVDIGNPAFGDTNLDRVTVTGALGQPALNGSYRFTIISSKVSDNVTTTTFTIPTTLTTATCTTAPCVANGTYNFSNEPQLAVAYGGPTSTSGHSDFGGGADSAVTFGLWGADDPLNCLADPSQPLPIQSPAYCDNELGTVLEQAGTLMHELGHTLTLTHGGTYYLPQNPPYVPTYGLNCKPNALTVMSYLFQVRGFPDGGIDYSGQIFSPLDETQLNETTGIGLDSLGHPAAHLTRWYGPPNALDSQLGRSAMSHCDGTPKLAGEAAVRVDGSLSAAPGSTFSGPLDWNNDLIVLGPVSPQDVNFNGIIGDAPFTGFNDWMNMDLRQISAATGGFGLSGGGGLLNGGGGLLNGGGGLLNGGGGLLNGGGGIDNSGSGLLNGGGGLLNGGGGLLNGGGGLLNGGGGSEQDSDAANSTADAPTGLTCFASITQNGVTVPACVSSSGSLVEKAKSVPLTWTSPSFGQTRQYQVWRALGSFPTLASVVANHSLFTKIGTLTGTPPTAMFVDTSVNTGKTYTYFVTDQNKQGAQSGASTPLVVTIGSNAKPKEE
jgi:hypothetical protein